MATAAQIAANRRNAQKSTGPRTPAGRNASKYNALKHGLVADTVLPHEDVAVFEETRAALVGTWQPADAQEFMLVDNILQGWWCMQRAQRFERAMFEAQLETMKRRHEKARACSALHDDEGIAVALGEPDNELGFNTLFRYSSRAEAKYYRAMDHLTKLQGIRFRRERQEAEARERSIARPGALPFNTKPVTSELASFGNPPETGPQPDSSDRHEPRAAAPQASPRVPVPVKHRPSPVDAT